MSELTEQERAELPLWAGEKIDRLAARVAELEQERDAAAKHRQAIDTFLREWSDRHMALSDAYDAAKDNTEAADATRRYLKATQGERLAQSVRERDELLSRLAAAERVVEKLPKTKDGVRVEPGMTVYEPTDSSHEGVWKWSVYVAAGCDGGTLIEECYSTREAALAAGKGAE